MPAITRSASAACMAPMMPTVGAKNTHRRTGDFLERLVFRKDAGVTRRRVVAKIESADLAVEAQRRAGDERHPVRGARAIDRMAGREVVRAVQHDGGLRHVSVEPGIVDAFRDGIHHHVGIQPCDRFAARIDLSATHRRRDMQDLALQIGEVDHVGVHQRQRPTPAAARYIAAGEPSPPAPTTIACASRKRCCASMRVRRQECGGNNGGVDRRSSRCAPASRNRLARGCVPPGWQVVRKARGALPVAHERG